MSQQQHWAQEYDEESFEPMLCLAELPFKCRGVIPVFLESDTSGSAAKWSTLKTSVDKNLKYQNKAKENFKGYGEQKIKFYYCLDFWKKNKKEGNLTTKK